MDFDSLVAELSALSEKDRQKRYYKVRYPCFFKLPVSVD